MKIKKVIKITKDKIKYCECGCGQMVKPGNRFISGHNSKVDHPMKGKKHSTESRDKMSKSHLELYESLEEREKISETVTKLWEDPEYRDRQSISRKKRWADPKEHEKMSKIHKESHKEHPITDETRRIMSKSGIKRHKENPFTDETIKKMCDSATKRYDDSLEREKQSVTQKQRYADMDDPRLEICLHHYIYDFNDLDKYTISVTRLEHIAIHNRLRRANLQVPCINILKGE